MERVDVDVAVVGGGQAGLAASHHLSLEGVEHLVLERGRVAEPALLAENGVEASVKDSFGSEELPTGLHAIVGRRTR